MKHLLKTVIALAAFTFLISNAVLADAGEKTIIALKTSDFELTETDISTLAIGEAQTIETENGKVIDILRTVDGAEVYVDGELLEINFGHEGVHEEHMIRKHVEVICEDDEGCDKKVLVHSAHDAEVSGWVTENGGDIIIHKEIELSCTDDEEGTSCTDEAVWVSENGDTDLETVHEMHASGNTHKVIVVKKEIVNED